MRIINDRTTFGKKMDQKKYYIIHLSFLLASTIIWLHFGEELLCKGGQILFFLIVADFINATY